MGQATTQPVICQGKEKRHQKCSSFQGEIIALQCKQLVVQAQQMQWKKGRVKKDCTFLLELGTLFTNKKTLWSEGDEPGLLQHPRWSTLW